MKRQEIIDLFKTQNIGTEHEYYYEVILQKEDCKFSIVFLSEYFYITVQKDSSFTMKVCHEYKRVRRMIIYEDLIAFALQANDSIFIEYDKENL